MSQLLYRANISNVWLLTLLSSFFSLAFFFFVDTKYKDNKTQRLHSHGIDLTCGTFPNCYSSWPDTANGIFLAADDIIASCHPGDFYNVTLTRNVMSTLTKSTMMEKFIYARSIHSPKIFFFFSWKKIGKNRKKSAVRYKHLRRIVQFQ